MKNTRSDLLVVDESAIGAFQVLDKHLLTVDEHPGMATGGLDIVERNLDILATTDDILHVGEQETLGKILTGHHDQVGFLAQSQS